MASAPSPETSRHHRSRWAELWLRPIDGAFLVGFRIAYGVAICYQALRYLSKGWVESYYIEPDFHFTYLGFGWVRPWPGEWMTVHFVAMAVLGAFVAVGFLYRLSAVLLCLNLTYWFLLDTTDYNNHYYLECLLAFLLIWMPAQRGLSVDALLRPSLRTGWVPRWTLWLLRAQIGIVYVYGGLAKFDPDWLTGVPIRAILGEHEGNALADFVRSPQGGLLLAYGGLALDLLVVPLLLWRKTRWPAFLAATAFHLSNAYLFRIAIFPWFMIAATALFFDPDSLGRLARRLWPGKLWRSARELEANIAAGPAQKVLLAGVGLYLVVQLLVPFRHLLYPGRITWTEEGFRFAWHMMLRHKVARTEFFVFTQEGESLPVEVDWSLHPKQWTYMQYDPAAVLQLAHYLEGIARTQGHGDVQVKVNHLCSLNGREPQYLIHPDVDLTLYRESWAPFPWLEPLQGHVPPPSPYGGRLDS